MNKMKSAGGNYYYYSYDYSYGHPNGKATVDSPAAATNEETTAAGGRK